MSPPRKSCSLRDDRVLSPPRNLVESAHRRSISSNTCSVEKFTSKTEKESFVEKGGDGRRDLNGFLKQQRTRITKVLDGEGRGTAKIVLSGTSNSTSSMLAAICYAWLLENKAGNEAERDEDEVVVPVINVRRSRMWKLRQAAWLFHHVGIDTTALLFADEVDLENLMMSRKLNILVVGQEVLRSSQEVGSQCTILTDNYCEDAYDLLQTPVLKKLLLAGILLDTQNLNASAKSSMTRDAEAVQLLLVGSSPNYRNTLYDQLMQDQKDGQFLEVLRKNYGNHPSERTRDPGALDESNVSARRSSSSPYSGAAVQYTERDTDTRSDRTSKLPPPPAKSKLSAEAPKAAPATDLADTRGKSKFSLAKWFGFGGK
uniref:Exopolyphosphatase n=1 Tax=Kalanchoe fedtschenkoi TaxID=63787 RepID=A0A7N1A6V0_KALFE